MEALAEKIPGETCRDVDSGTMEAPPLVVIVIKVPPGLAAYRWAVVYEGEDPMVEASEDLREGVWVGEGLVGLTAEATDIRSNLKWKVSRTLRDWRKIVKKLNLALILLTGLVIVSGCYYYVPHAVVASPGPPYASYDYIWDSLMRAAQDVGIQITTSNKNTGTIIGQRDRVGVTIQVTQQADGKTRIELTARDSQGSSSTIADDFYRAYDHYMGRR